MTSSNILICQPYVYQPEGHLEVFRYGLELIRKILDKKCPEWSRVVVSMEFDNEDIIYISAKADILEKGHLQNFSEDVSCGVASSLETVKKRLT